jgi:hypothetical protein
MFWKGDKTMSLFDHEMSVPSMFREVLGAQQSKGALLCIGVTVAVAIGLLGPQLMGTDTLFIAPWQRLLAGLLILDIVAGAVANFTPGTNAFYASRPRWRWGFISIHIHLLLVGWLLNQPMGSLIAIWGYTILASSAVNLAFHRTWQPLLAGCLLCIGLVSLSMLRLEPLLLATSVLFMVKVLFAFAVNHYPNPCERAI